MKSKALVAKTKDANSYNSIVFENPDTLSRVRGCEFSIVFLFGAFTDEEVNTLGNKLPSI